MLRNLNISFNYYNIYKNTHTNHIIILTGNYKNREDSSQL